MAGWWVETLTAPEPAAITTTGGAPTVTATQHKTVVPGAASIHLTGHAPAPAGIVATPSAGTMTATGGAPAVKQDTPVTPSGATITATGGTPSVVKNTIITPSPKTTTVTGGTPTVTNASPVSYDAVGTPSTGFGSISSFNFTAATGADVFVAVNWDRSGASVTGVTYGGVAMSLVGSVVSHNNTPGLGGIAVYRLAGAGNGSAKSVAVTVSGGAWYIANAVSAKSVTSVGTAVTAFGSSATASQALTVASGLMLQFVSSGNSGAGVGDYTSFSGATNRWHGTSTGGAMAINTVTATGTASSTSSGSQPWAAIAIPLS